MMMMMMTIIVETIQKPHFIVPFLFWLTCYLYCYFRPSSSSSSSSKTVKVVPFQKWYLIHNIHNFGAILLGTISILSSSTTTTTTTTTTLPTSLSTIIQSLFGLQNNNNNIDPTFQLEQIPILWSLSYFTIDIIDCAVRFDIPYLFHAICCFVLGTMNYTIPLLQILQMNSKASFCELSNPFMHLAKRTRQPIHFILFAIVYTCCRIIWIPIMFYQLVTYEALPQKQLHGDTTAITTTITTRIPWYHPICCILIAFYLLNLYWYYKIVRILLTGVGGSENSTTKSSTSSRRRSRTKTAVSPSKATTATTTKKDD